MSARDRATKHMGLARRDRREADFVCPKNAAGLKREGKREMAKARRALDRVEIEERP